MSHEYELAARSFQDTLERLTEGAEVLSADEQQRVGRRAARMAAAEATWSDHLGPLLPQDAVCDILGITTRQGVNDLARRRRILGLPTREGRLYPAFQFKDRRPLPGLTGVLQVLLESASEATVASWLQTPQPELSGRAPAEALTTGDSESLDRVHLAAVRAAARLDQ